jgi:chromate transporter
MPSVLGIFVFFLRLGGTAFGGPAAHIARMEELVVRDRGWVGRERFLDLLGAANLLPGPSSTELAIFLGRELGGAAGLVAAGAGFILPGVLLTLAAAWAYARWGALPALGGVLYGVKPVIVAVVAQALVRLGRSALKTRLLALVGAAAAGGAALGVEPVAALLGAGALCAAARAIGSRERAAAFAPALPAAAAAAGAKPGLFAIFGVFFKTSAALFGSGYVLLAFLRADLVERRAWITEAQLIDAVAVGQVTPGPVFSTATFLGYLVAGAGGAAAATLGIFAPAFLLVAVSSPLVARARRSPAIGAFLDGVNVAALGLMALVTIQIGRAAVMDAHTGRVDIPAAALAVGTAVLLLRFRVGSLPLIAAGALIGEVVTALR